MTSATDIVLPSQSSDTATRVWVNLVFLLTFFPSLIDSLLPSQTQPLAGFAALPLLFLRPIHLNRTTLPALIGITVVIAYIVGSLFIFPEISFPILSNGTTYFMGAILLLAMWDKLHLLNPSMFRWALAVWVVVGCVQAFPFPAGIKELFVVLLKPLVSDRFTMDTYSVGGRGVILLASEPSISAPSVLYFGLTALFLRDRGMIGRREFWLSLAMVMALAAFNRSGTMVVLLLIAAFGWSLDLIASQSPRNQIVIAGVIGGFLALLFVFVGVLPTDIRGIGVLQAIVQALKSFSSFHDLFTATLYIGAQRGLMLAYGYGSLVDNYGLGHGVATWTLDWVLGHVIQAIGLTQADLNAGVSSEAGFQIKPAAYFAVIAFDTGLPGLVPMFWTVASAFFWRKRRAGLPARRFVFLLPGVGWLLVFITAGLLSPWMLICFAMSYFTLENSDSDAAAALSA